MDPAATGAPQSFDLTADAQAVRHRARTARLVWVALGAVVLGIGFWLALPPYNQSPIEELGPAAGIVVIGALVVVNGLRHHVPHLVDRLTLTPEALQFHETDGTHGDLRWADPTFGLTLIVDANPLTVPGEATPRVGLALPNGGRARVPRPIATAIVQSASGHGLPVLVREELEPAGRFEVTRIGRPEHSPGWKFAVAAK